MFKITESAAAQIKLSKEKLGEATLRLRISARFAPEHGIAYKMGFDDVYDTDITLEINNIEIIYDKDSEKLIKGMVIDYRELNGEMQIVFENPNDMNPENMANNSFSDR